MAVAKRIVAYEPSEGFNRTLTGETAQCTCPKCNSYLPYGGPCHNCAESTDFKISDATPTSQVVKHGDWTTEEPNNVNS